MDHKKTLAMPDGRLADTIKITILGFGLVVTSLLLQCNIGINRGDEGYLWYGVLQTMAGKVPVRDFQSYDPGRYYWSGFWMLLFGKGIISLRLSVAIFQAIGLTLGLLALRRVIRSWSVLFIAASILLMWMIPRHKLFDSSLSIAAVYFALRLIENPSLRQHFISGIFVGVAAFFGRNHGVYSFAAFAGLILFIRLRLEKTKLLTCGFAWGLGILLGYLPMLIMLLAVPGFFDAFLLPFVRMLRRGTTNLTLPVPWPWAFDHSRMGSLRSIYTFSVGIFFILLPLVHVFNIISLFVCKKDFLKKSSLLAASTFVGVMYMHYAFSRADIGHLALGIAPFLIALFTLPHSFNFARKKILCTILLTGLFIMTFLSSGAKSEYCRKAIGGSGGGEGVFIKSDVAGDQLWVRRKYANHIEVVKYINSQMVSADEGFLIAPDWPFMYPVLQRESPLWDIYFLFPETEPRQKEIIETLKRKKVNWILLSNMPLDGREDRMFSSTHEILWEYFERNYDPLRVQGLSGSYRLLRRKPDK